MEIKGIFSLPQEVSHRCKNVMFYHQRNEIFLGKELIYSKNLLYKRNDGLFVSIKRVQRVK